MEEWVLRAIESTLRQVDPKWPLPYQEDLPQFFQDKLDLWLSPTMLVLSSLWESTTLGFENTVPTFIPQVVESTSGRHLPSALYPYRIPGQGSRHYILYQWQNTRTIHPLPFRKWTGSNERLGKQRGRRWSEAAPILCNLAGSWAAWSQPSPCCRLSAPGAERAETTVNTPRPPVMRLHRCRLKKSSSSVMGAHGCPTSN